MSMAFPANIDVYSTAQLLGAFGVIDRTNPALLNAFFKMEQTFDTEQVFFDQVTRARRLAPFVVSTVEGKAEPSRGFSAQSFSPPYVKPKHAVEPVRALKRRMGEQLLGSLTPEQRFQLAVLDNLRLEDDEIARVEEWMAAQLLLTGSVTCTSADHPPITINLNRNASHTVTLTSGARWGDSGVDALDNLRTWAETVQTDSGFHPSQVYMDPKAASLFIKSSGVLTVMQSFRQTQGNIDLTGAAVGGAPGREVRYLGSIPDFDFYVYQQLYADSAGTVHKIMPDYSVIMGSDGAQGIRTYGAILDRKALMPLARFPKVWDEEDPSVTFSMTQSAPLPLMGWINGTFAATVYS